jgi:hypothetical protein
MKEKHLIDDYLSAATKPSIFNILLEHVYFNQAYGK